MRYCISLALCLFIFESIQAQIVGGGNHKPKIKGQNPVSTNEEQAVTIEFWHLIVRDQDDWFYPFGFTLRVYDGANYTRNGNTVTPVTNFYGTLTVPVTVNDGKDDSEKYNLEVTVKGVNDAPVITAQSGALVTEENKTIQIQLSHLVVSDPDNPYPNGFSLTVHASANNQYSVSGTQVTPAPGFTGNLLVPVHVSDGAAASNSYSLSIEVKPNNKAPAITGQVPLVINEDESLLIQVAHLTVNDPDNSYPTGFRITIHPGDAYVVSGATVTPVKNFSGNLVVTVTVNDGKSESNAYGLQIKVIAVNDAPEIIQFPSEALRYQIGKGATAIVPEFEAKDVDNDSLVSAEIGFLSEQYKIGIDELSFKATSKIKGSFDPQRGLLVLSGRAPLNEYNQVIRAVAYNYVVIGDPLKETKTIFFRVSDGKAVSEKKERQIITTDIIVKLDIPTAFTPNGDAANDTWKIRPIKQQDEIMEVVIRIYNRFGRLLFETVGFEREWDGRLNGELLPADTYYYTIDFGREYTKSSVKGIVALLR